MVYPVHLTTIDFDLMTTDVIAIGGITEKISYKKVFLAGA
jgi:hypothetical protein